ncbi:MAG: glycosyl hydrolase 115 family protein [Christensenellales bacterium]
MVKIFEGDVPAQVYYSADESNCISLAVQDLTKDLRKVSGTMPIVHDTLPDAKATGIIVGTLTNDAFCDYLRNNLITADDIRGQWEQYILLARDGVLVICGSDERGTMWGIYELCEKFLHVDPLYLWTDHTPKRMEQLILSETRLTGGPETFRFRGWFINDEDLLTGWSKKAASIGRYFNDSSFYAAYPPVLEQILETALRLRQNLMIPCSHLDLDDPFQENIVRMTTERGLYISQHHQQPVGVSQSAVDRYWKARGVYEPLNYHTHPDKYHEVWEHYISKWGKYDNVIWQLGLRGRGDRPVWYQNKDIPESSKARGKIISDAIAAQAEIAKKAYAGKPFLTTSTLWMEGMSLYQEGALTFPEDTIVVFADFGPSQMLDEGYDITGRQPDTAYGVYYHVAFWGCGPHLVQGTSPAKILYNYRRLVKRGDNCYSVLNVSNVREHVLGIQCVANITWNIERFCDEEFLIEWCCRKLGLSLADAQRAALLYHDYFQCFHKMDNTRIDGEMLLMDGMCRRVAVKLVQLISGAEFQRDDIQNKLLFGFDSKEAFIDYYCSASGEGLVRWKRLYREAYEVLNLIEDRESSDFFTSHCIVHTELMLALYSWVYNLTLAAKARQSANANMFAQYVEEAVFALSKAAIDRQKAERGKWQGWYIGDQLICLNEDIELTTALLYMDESGLSEKLSQVRIL